MKISIINFSNYLIESSYVYGPLAIKKVVLSNLSVFDPSYIWLSYN